jgi:transcription elongation factor Elf1
MNDTDATRARHNVVADVDEILEHVINANMLSMPYDVYSELFDAVDGLGVKVEKTEAENAKLRELVRDMWEGYNDPRCEECHLKDTPTCADCPICAREALVIDRMRDLGIEVDG